MESPLPQEDVAGNVYIRTRINRPVAMHYGSPPIETALREDVTDGFVLGAGAAELLQQAHVVQAAHKPFWLQLVGTGLTTTGAAHFGAALPGASWPAVTDMHLWESQLITPQIEVRGGYYQVPEKPGLGIEIDQAAVERYRVDYTFLEPPTHIYRYVRATGEVTYYGCGKQELHHVYPKDAQPIAKAGSALEVVPDDGSETFAELKRSLRNGHVIRRMERPVS